jgi:hypothetical protein
MADPEPPIRIAPAQQPPTATPSRLTAASTATIRTAVVGVHGMGQQLQFDMLETVATALRTAAMRAGDRVSELVAGSVTAGADRLQRLEIAITAGDRRHVVHVYETLPSPRRRCRVSPVLRRQPRRSARLRLARRARCTTSAAACCLEFCATRS